MTSYESSKTTSSKIFQGVLIIIFIILSFICIFPFLNIIGISFSSATAIMSGKVVMLPVDLTFDAYKQVLGNSSFIYSFFYTIYMTLVYTFIAMAVTIAAAYPLSKKDLKGRNVIMAFIVFTMYFDGGIIPHYILIKNLKLMDTMWALIIPGMISAYNLIIMRSFFSSIDSSILEAAYLDGCSELRILIKIILPLSTPVIATLSLFYAIGRWNGVSDAMFYINKASLFPLQLKLRELILMDQVAQQEASNGGQAVKVVAENMKSASIVLTTLPILMVYPFAQKYFTKGIMLGSVKG